jgi:hypothetical protein
VKTPAIDPEKDPKGGASNMATRQTPDKPKRKPLKMSKPKLKTGDTRTVKPRANPKRIKKLPDGSYDV